MGQDPAYARDTTTQWCDKHLVRLDYEATEPQLLKSGYNMWGPDRKCTYMIHSGSGYNSANEIHGAPSFRISEVTTGASYNPEVWDFDLHYIEYDDRRYNDFEDDDAHFVDDVPTYSYSYCKDEIKNYYRYYNVLGSIVKSNSGAINLYTGLNNRSVDRTDGGYNPSD